MKVLLGVDGTENAFRALDRTLDRAAATGDAVTVAVVPSEGEDAATEERVRDALSTRDVDADVTRVDADEAGSKLVEMAEAGDYDEIVLGGGTRSPMGKIRLGDMREFVVLNADVTVTLVR